MFKHKASLLKLKSSSSHQKSTCAAVSALLNSFKMSAQRKITSQHYDTLGFDDDLIEELKVLLNQSMDSKEDLKKLFRPEPNISLFYSAVKSNAALATYIIHFAMKHEVDSNVLLDPVDGIHPLPIAFSRGEYYLVEMMLQCDPDVPVDHLFQTDAQGRTLLHLLAIQGDVLSLETILRFASLKPSTATNLLQPDCQKRTPIHYLAMKYKTCDKIVDVLTLAASKRVELMPLLLADSEGRTPLHMICNHKDDYIYDFIPRKGPAAAKRMLQIADGCSHLAVILKADEQGQTPFHIAVEKRHKGIIEEIISATECDKQLARTLFARDKIGLTPLSRAFDCRNKVAETVMLFALDNGINCKTSVGRKYSDLVDNMDNLIYRQILRHPWIWPTLYPSQSSVVLNGPTHSRNTERIEWNGMDFNLISDDVLLKIFEYLDVVDLYNCELACRKWRHVIVYGNAWRKLLGLKSNCPSWQRIAKTQVEDAPHMGLKEICRMIYKRVELLDRNWQLGKYDMKMNELHLDFCWDNLKHDGDHMLYHWQHCGFTLIDRRITPTVQEFGAGIMDVIMDFEIHNNIIVMASKSAIKVFDATTNQQVNELGVPHDYAAESLCFGHGLLAALSKGIGIHRQLTVWRVISATDIQHVLDESITEDCGLARVQMDERYIAVFLEKAQSTRIDFISTATLNVEQSMEVAASDGRILRYHRGLLITKNANFIRLTDVRTRCSRVIDLKPSGFGTSHTKIGANSKYLIAMNRLNQTTKVGVFDLHADSTTPFCHFIVPFNVKWFAADETELICITIRDSIAPDERHHHVTVLDFLSTPSIRPDEMEASNESLFKCDETVRCWTIAKEIKKIRSK